MLRPTVSALIRCATALALLLGVSAVIAVAQEPVTTPPDDAPAESFPSRAPSLDTGPGAGTLRSQAPSLPLPQAISNIGGGIWLAKGPGPTVFGQVEMINGPNEVVGAVHTLAADPGNADILYAGGVNGGVWKTTNATATSPMWTPLTDFETSLSIGALEFDPTDATHNTLVAGVGRFSSFFSNGGSRTGTLLKTTDGGATWFSLPGIIGPFAPANISGVAPRGMTLVASSNDSSSGFCSDFGIFRSVDGGASFTQLTTAVGVPAGVAFDLASDATSASTLYTGITFAGACSATSNGIFKSTDTGASWTKVSDAAMDALIVDGTTNNIEIAAHGSDVYVDIIQLGRPVGIFHSANGGTTWTAMDIPRTPEGTPSAIATLIPGAPIEIDTGMAHGLGTGMEIDIAGVTGTVGANGVSLITVASDTAFFLDGSSDFTAWGGAGTWNKVVGLSPKVKPGGQGSIHASIRVDPTTPSTVYVGGDRQDDPFPNSVGALDYSGRLFRGDTGVAPTGAIPSPQWEHLTHSIGPPTAGGGTISGSAPHADSREMVFDADGNLIEGDDGGIYRRTSPATSGGDWFSVNGNLQVNEQHDVAYDSVSNIIISGNQDTGTTQQQTPNGLSWDSVSTGDGGDVAVDDVSAPGVSTRYSSFQNLDGFRRQVYDTNNMILSTTFIVPTFLGTETSLTPQFTTPVVLDPITPTSLVIGACNAIFESFDQGDTVTEIGGSVGIDCPNALVYGGNFNGVPDPGTTWAAVGAAVYQRLGPAGSFSLLDTYPGVLTVTDITVDPSATNTAYVTDGAAVYRTYNDGVTWETLTGDLTDTQIQSVTIDPAGRLFVGGREGVSAIALPAHSVASVGPYVWGQIGTGLPNAPVWDMEWDSTDGVLVVGTLGRGSWVLQENGACAGGTVPDKLVVNNQWVAGMQLDEACTQITAGPSLDVTATGDLTLKAPAIILDNGFAVKTGGLFTAENTVP